MKISLVGIGVKIFSIAIALVIGSLMYVILFLADEKNILFSVFIIFVFLICILFIYISFAYKIVMYEDYMIIMRPLKQKVLYSEIKSIYCTDDKVETSIYIKFNGSKLRITGYMVLINKRKRNDLTRQIVNRIIEYINENHDKLSND